MKNLIILYSLLLITACVSTASTLINFNDRIYRFCSSEEIPNPAGKVCYRYCKKYRFLSDKCKEWDLIIHDLSDELEYNRFMNGNFVIIKRDSI